MQGQRSSLGSLPELSFHPGSASSDSNIDPPQRCWTTLMNPSQEDLMMNQWSLNETNSDQLLSLNTVDPSLNIEQSFMQNSSSVSAIPQLHSSNLQFAPPNIENDGTSETGGYIVEQSSDVASGSRRVSCKRKTLEGEPSSGSGSSNNVWHVAPTVNNNVSINFSEQVNPGLGLSIGGSTGTTNVPVTSNPSRSVEHVRRHLRSRMNGLHQHDNNNNSVSVQRSMRLQPSYNRVDLTPPSVQRSTVPLLRSRSNRTEGSSAPIPIPQPSNISAHPMFIPSSQNPVNWGLAASSTSRVGPLGPVPEPVPAPAPAPAPALVQQRNIQNYQRRVSEFLRRSVMSGGNEDNNSYNSGILPATTQGTAHGVVPVGSGTSTQGVAVGSTNNNNNQSHHHQRLQAARAMLLERHLGVSPRALASATPEGRSRLVSEIRSVLDLMRRGEGLRLEDVMILDQSVFFGMADIQDRHRDMRLDVDNMSYEELLALGERIGDVCTGLTEETIANQLKQTKFVSMKTNVQVEVEPCSVCQEEYSDGEALGTLECGHEFHSECIKQWLMQKNLCPICKTTGLNAK